MDRLRGQTVDQAVKRAGDAPDDATVMLVERDGSLRPAVSP
jgi:hypothetical protein